MKTPEISIIMSVYNGEEYLRETIESIIGQTFKEWELVAVNDCSSDLTSSILEEYASKDERIKVYNNEVNLKLPTSLNKAISLSSGKYIARMDADDICLPDRFEKQYKFMEENKDVDLSSCRFLTLKNGSYASGGCGGRCDNDSIRAMLLVTNPILHPGVIIRAQKLKSLNYDVTLTCTEDLELWTRMVMQNMKICILPEYLLIYRLHDKQITSTTIERQHKEVLKIQDTFYGKLLGGMEESLKSFYISGIYFKENADISKFCAYLKWLRNANREKKAFKAESIDYAMLEILAEYKRVGISRADIIKGMLSFGPLFLAKEIARRKKEAKRDIISCRKAAESLGLMQTSGTSEFPIFTKK